MNTIKPQKLELLVTETKWENSKILKIGFKVRAVDKFRFFPGQHITILTDTKVARSYSIYSQYLETNEIFMIVSAGHEGDGVNFLKKLKEGDVVNGLGPLGKIALDTDYKENILFVASGVGSVPLMTMVYKLCKDKDISASVIEDFAVGLNHAEIGARIVEKWHFPEQLASALRYHHEPLRCDIKFKDICYTVYLANAICNLENEKITFDQIEPVVVKDFGIDSEEQLIKIQDRLLQAFSDQRKGFQD